MRSYLENEIDSLNWVPGENSDFDTDSEVHPLDSIAVGNYTSSRITSENQMKKKPI